MGLEIGKQKMEIPIQANGLLTIPMDMANINGQMVIYMKASGLMTEDMVSYCLAVLPS
jgi:hypothetical protein